MSRVGAVVWHWHPSAKTCVWTSALLAFLLSAGTSGAAQQCELEGNCPAEDVEEVALLAQVHRTRVKLKTGGESRAHRRVRYSADPCVTDPVGWADSKGYTCADYAQKNWCNSDGSQGSGWSFWYGSFAGWAVDGVDATKACCECGGGTASEATQACVFSEAVDDASAYGLDFFVQSSGCNISKCKPEQFSKEAVPEVFSVVLEGTTCGCWANAMSDDGGMPKYVLGQRTFLFSFVMTAEQELCDAKTCWEKYSRVLGWYKLSPLLGSTPGGLEESSLTLAPNWTASCQYVHPVERHNHVEGLHPVSDLVNTLYSWGAAEQAEEITRFVNIHSDLDELQAKKSAVGLGALLPPVASSVLERVVNSWKSLLPSTLQTVGANILGLKELFTGTMETMVKGNSFNADNYHSDMVSFLVNCLISTNMMKVWFRDRSGGATIAAGPGPKTTYYYSYHDVKKMQMEFGAKFENGSVTRENELGMLVLNTALWPDAPGGKASIGLGASRDNHAFVRPLLADVLDNAQGQDCDGSTCWSPEWLQSQARTFLSGRTSVKNSDLEWYVAKLLHKVHLNMDISDDEAQDFAAFKKSATALIVWPETEIDDYVLQRALNIGVVQAKRAAYLEKYRTAIEAKFPNVTFSSSELDMTASAFLDSLLFAGGASVPTVLESVLGLMHQRKETKWPVLQDIELSEENMESILWETMRLYPEVKGYPYWEMEDGEWHHKVVAFPMALVDGAVYEDPDIFKLRPVATARNLSIMFNDFANHPDSAQILESNRAPHSRRCPGKELAIQLMLSFLKEFIAQGPWMRKEYNINVHALGASSFTLLKDPESVCIVPQSKCTTTFVYKFRTYNGCTSVDADEPWCSYDPIHLYGRWAKCEVKPAPCPPTEEDRLQEAELGAVDALLACSGVDGTAEQKAKCICHRADKLEVEQARVQRCADLSGAASEIGYPWSCAVKQVMGRKGCYANAPWHKRLKQRVSQAWKAVLTWGKSLSTTSKCFPTCGKLCSQKALGVKAVQCKSISHRTLSYDWLDLPEQMQGIFWLTEQGPSSALVSFGRTCDGAGISTGKVQNRSYKIRVGGDRSWSFSSETAGNIFSALDLVYDFQLNDNEDPSFARIVPKSRRVLGISVPPALMAFNISLVRGGDAEYPGSVVWQRTSDLLGKIHLSKGTYRVVQVVDGKGRRLPAYDAFQKFCDDPSGSSPGQIWVRSYEQEPYTVSSIQEQIDRCPSIVGYAAGKMITEAFILSIKFGRVEIRSWINDPPFDPKVYDPFSYLVSLSIIHAKLKKIGGANNSAEERICLPQVTHPLDKVRDMGNIAPIEDSDMAQITCAPVDHQMKLRTLCLSSAIMGLPLDDGMEEISGNTSGNSWDYVLGDSGRTKEEYLMSYFEPYVNEDGEKIYPAQEVDWQQLFLRKPGVWDDALETQLVMDMLGSHLVGAVQGRPPSHGGETAALVVSLDVFSALQIRSGFSNWGSNMYFTADGRIFGIERNTLGGTPEWVYPDAHQQEWQYAKFVFRSTLFSAVTAIDHLWFAHLSVSNPLATVSREHLLPHHPLRRLLTAATLNTVDVNIDAQQSLLTNKQLLHRLSPFEDWESVHEAARQHIKTFQFYFGPFLNSSLLKEKHPRVQQAPLYQDGPHLMLAISNMLDRYFAAMGEEWCEPGTGDIVDQGLMDFANGMESWFLRERSARADANLQWLKGSAWTCTSLKKLLTCFLFAVSGFHQHVGKVADYTRNPDFLSFSWAPGETYARPRQAMLAAIVSATTSARGVPMAQNFEFLAKGLAKEAPLKEVLAKFHQDLLALGQEIDVKNKGRKVAYTRMHPKHAEISLYQ